VPWSVRAINISLDHLPKAARGGGTPPSLTLPPFCSPVKVSGHGLISLQAFFRKARKMSGFDVFIFDSKESKIRKYRFFLQRGILSYSSKFLSVVPFKEKFLFGI
jgi:hypothetical protein